MKNQKKFILLFVIILVGLTYRVPRLSQRPMHTDEAVHAIKFGELLEHNRYRYNPVEYHGPTLNYFTLIPAWLFSDQTIKECNESTLRIVPVFFGFLLLLFLIVLTKELEKTTVIFAVLFTSISSAMVFYSRYYIQEILLVCFTFATIAAGYRSIRTKSASWAVLTGICVGLMHATKETWIISFGSMLVALLLIFFLRVARKEKQELIDTVKKINLWHVVLALLSATFISLLFYSSFFMNPKGILDSVLSYRSYIEKAGQHEYHLYPWFTYFKWLFFFKSNAGPLWSEVFLLILAFIGIGAMFSKRNGSNHHDLLHFIAFFTIIMTIIYCLIPYKTPWSMLSFFQGLILLAAYGATRLFHLTHRIPLKIFIHVFLLCGTLHLALQSYQLNFVYDSNPINPYVYSHPGDDVLDIGNRMDEIALSQPDGYDLYIQVIFPENDYWPLPWYLRKCNKIGWWSEVDMMVPSAPIIFISPQIEKNLIAKLYDQPNPGEQHLYIPLFKTYKELRPGAEIRGFIQYDLWNRIQQNR